jgi:hypothetical protein
VHRLEHLVEVDLAVVERIEPVVFIDELRAVEEARQRPWQIFIFSLGVRDVWKFFYEEADMQIDMSEQELTQSQRLAYRAHLEKSGSCCWAGLAVTRLQWRNCWNHWGKTPNGRVGHLALTIRRNKLSNSISGTCRLSRLAELGVRGDECRVPKLQD